MSMTKLEAFSINYQGDAGPSIILPAKTIYELKRTKDKKHTRKLQNHLSIHGLSYYFP